MLKKIVSTIILSVIIIALVSCKNDTNNNIEKRLSDEDQLMLEKLNSEMGNYGTAIENVTDWKTVIEYTGTPVTLEILLHNLKDAAQYGIILFADGIRIPFTTNEHNQTDYMQIFHLETEETDHVVTITFSPNLTVGETVVINIATILNPYLIPENLDSPRNIMYHNLLSNIPYRVKINASDIQEDILISNTINREEPLTNEVENKFIRETNDNQNSNNSASTNELDIASQFRLFQESLDAVETYYEVQSGEDLKLNLSWFGKSGNYRISMYINHEIIPVFDGTEYFDANVNRELIRTKLITIPAEILKNFEEFNHIYFIAVPLEQEEDISLIKNNTRILHIQSN